jgi:hypothetical protein
MWKHTNRASRIHSTASVAMRKGRREAGSTQTPDGAAGLWFQKKSMSLKVRYDDCDGEEEEVCGIEFHGYIEEDVIEQHIAHDKSGKQTTG